MPFRVDDDDRERPQWDTIRRIHVLGVCGSAMGAFAGMLQSLGYEVRGSDAAAYPPMSDTLRRLGIAVMAGYDAAHLEWGPEAVIMGNVIRRDNPEAVAVRALGLPHVSFPEALHDLFLRTRHRITVAGTHGKTTTTALTAWLLEAAGAEPSFLIGGLPANFGQAFRVSGGPAFVIEADEYDTAYFDKRPKLVHYAPQTAILTNIEFDHADIYRDLDHVVEAFELYASLVAADGALIVWGDDVLAMRVARTGSAPVVSYGFGPHNAWRATELTPLRGGMSFRLTVEGTDAGTFWTPMTGRHNTLNALAALAAANRQQVELATLRDGLARFEGVAKRQQVRGEVAGVLVIDDYAHHPTAVRETLAALRQRYPGRRMWGLFEAESNTSRRRLFQDAYAEALATADCVVLSKPLKKNDNLAETDQIDVRAVTDALRDRGKIAEHIPEFAAIADYVAEHAEPGDVIVGMSGRDFGGVHAMILDRLRVRFAVNQSPSRSS